MSAITPREQWLNELAEWEGKPAPFPICPKCNDTGTVCWACDAAIDECECGEDQGPTPCDRCHGPPDPPGWEGGFAENH